MPLATHIVNAFWFRADVTASTIQQAFGIAGTGTGLLMVAGGTTVILVVTLPAFAATLAAAFLAQSYLGGYAAGWRHAAHGRPPIRRRERTAC